MVTVGICGCCRFLVRTCWSHPVSSPPKLGRDEELGDSWEESNRVERVEDEPEHLSWTIGCRGWLSLVSRKYLRVAVMKTVAMKTRLEKQALLGWGSKQECWGTAGGGLALEWIISCIDWRDLLTITSRCDSSVERWNSLKAKSGLSQLAGNLNS